MRSCCVDGCEVTSEDIIFFELPTSRSLRRRWLDVIKISEKITVDSVVCSQHFMTTDYETFRGKVRLKRKVVPSVQLNVKTPIQDEPTPQQPQSKELNPPSPTALQPSIEKDSTKISDEKVKNVETNPPTIDTQTDNKVPSKNSNITSNGTERTEKQDSEKTNKNKDCEVSLPKLSPHEPDPKGDIEDMITNYHIKNKIPNPALQAERPEVRERSEVLEVSMSPDIEIVPETAPVFIEISVDKDVSAADGGAGSQDCLMLLESVEVELDPSTLMLPERDYDDEDDKAPDKKEDPISLLTSSDEDDVILQEPKIDTVEVSDETDEDDMPLMRLVKTKPKKQKKLTKKQITPEQALKNVMWGVYEYYCMACHYTTTSRSEYKRHVAEHSTVLQICSVCSFTTASKSQYYRHMRKHKEERRFKCHQCGYKAKHNMSLIYHLKSHEKDSKTSNRGFKCKKCGFRSDDRSVVVKHVRLCKISLKRYSCSNCEYSTGRRSDLKRHRSRKHKDIEDDDEDHISSAKRFSCNDCDYTTDKSSDLKKHRSRRHKDIEEE